MTRDRSFLLAGVTVGILLVLSPASAEITGIKGKSGNVCANPECQPWAVVPVGQDATTEYTMFGDWTDKVTSASFSPSADISAAFDRSTANFPASSIRMRVTVAADADPGQGGTSPAIVVVTVNPLPLPRTASTPRDGFKVCIGTAADRDKYGTHMTPASGIAGAFTGLPTGADVLITVEKDRYLGWQQAWTLRSGTDNHILARPGPGSAGPTCTPESINATTIVAAPAAPPVPKIDSFSLNGGDKDILANEAVQLGLTYSGVAPTEFRASATSNQFPETWATWRAINTMTVSSGATKKVLRFPGPNGLFPSQTPAKKTVYLQVRTGGQVSNVVSDEILIVTEYVLNGADVYRFAASKGYSFPGSPVGCVILDLSGHIHIGTVSSDFSIGGSCTFNLFAGRQLNPGWTFRDILFQNDTPKCMVNATRPVEGANTLETRLVLIYPTGCKVRLAEVRLFGPVATEWRYAFYR